MSSQSPHHHHLPGDDGDVIDSAVTNAIVTASTALPSAATSTSEPHLVPPAVSPNVASVVPAIPTIPQPATNALFDETVADPFAVHENDGVLVSDPAKNADAVAAESEAHANAENAAAQQVDVGAVFPQHPDPDAVAQNTSAFNDPPPQHGDAVDDADMQTNQDSIVTSMPVVSQDMNQIPVSLSGTAHPDAAVSVPMVTVSSEPMGIHNVNVSGAMPTDIYTSTAGSVVVSAAQLSNAHNQAFTGMEYMANPTTDQPHQQMAQIGQMPQIGQVGAPTDHVGNTAANNAAAQNFSVGHSVDDDGAPPKFQDVVVSVVAALPGSEGGNPVPVVTSAQPPNLPVVTPQNSNAANAGVIATVAEIPYGGETVDKCVECEVCGSLFGDAGSLKRHAARAHKANTGKGPVYCSQCSAQLKNEQNLRRHIAVCHSGSQENRCNFCSASFSSRGSLRIHQQTVHALAPAASSKGANKSENKGTGRPRGIVKPKAEKSYLCDMCTDTFKWKGNLKRHRELRHLQLRPFSCHICQASFGTKSNMRVHLITHQNNGTAVTPQMPK